MYMLPFGVIRIIRIITAHVCAIQVSAWGR